MAETCRLRGRIGVERRLADVPVARPEAERDEVVRVRLPVDWAESRCVRRALAVEACHREVEGVPEEVHGARLAAVPPGEGLEHAVGPVEDPPEALDCVGVVGDVFYVLRERCRRRDPVRRLSNRDVDAKVAERRVQPLVECSDGQVVDEGERFRLATARANDEPMIDEIEVDLVARPVRRVEPSRCEPTDVEVERNVPPVVSRRRGRHTDLADDLHPEVEGLLRLLPPLEGQRRQAWAARSRCTVDGRRHDGPPVGPNRSVLIRPGSCPSSTRLDAAVSTKAVGPQT